MHSDKGSDEQLADCFQIDPKLVQRNIAAEVALMHATEHAQVRSQRRRSRRDGSGKGNGADAAEARDSVEYPAGA